MKTFNKTILVLLAVVAISFTSCKSDDDGGDGGGGSAGAGTVVAKVNGNSFTSLEITSFATLATGNGVKTLIIQGSDAAGKAINLQINANYEGPGTYKISDSNVFTFASYIAVDINNPQNTKSWSAPYEGSGVVGEIIISGDSTETQIIGSFNFTAKNVNGDQSLANITEGSFNVKVQ